MSLTVIADVKQQLGLENDSTKDAFLANLILRAQKLLEKYCGRKFDSATYTEFYDGDGTDELLLNQYPIVSVTSLHDDLGRTFDSLTLISTSDYVIYKERGKIKLTSSEPSQSGRVFARGAQNVKVIYVAGYDPVPEDLQDAALQQIEHMFNRAKTGGFTSRSMGGISETYDPEPIPETVKRSLRHYRKYGHSGQSTT